MALDQGSGIAGVGFQVKYTRRVRIEHRIIPDLLIRWQPDRRMLARLAMGSNGFLTWHDLHGLRTIRSVHRFARAGFHGIGVSVRFDAPGAINPGGINNLPVIARQPARRRHECRAAYVADLAGRFAPCQTMSDFDQCPFGVTKQQQIGLAVGQHRTANLVGPVIVMGNATQARFNRTDDDGGIRISLTRALAVHHHGTVGALVGLGIWRIGVVGADLAIRGVTIHHRIHIAGGDAVKQLRLAQAAEVCC